MEVDWKNYITLITIKIMKDKQCTFDFSTVGIEKVKSLLNALPDEMSSGVDNMDGKLLKIATKNSPTLSYL